VTTLAIVQARMSSTRYPGKVLAPLAGQPMILRQLERIQRAKTLDAIVVATSTDASDEELAQLVKASGFDVLRGDLNDVLARFIKVIDQYQPETVVRLTADCPLISPKVIDQVVARFNQGDCDYASNTMTPTYPDGLDVEVVKASVLQEVYETSTDKAEREHVTLGVYRNPDKYRIANFAGEVDLSYLRWTVDTPEDYAFVSEIYDELYPKNPNFDIDDVISYLQDHPERTRTANDAMRNAALTGLDTGVMNDEIRPD
jgi:spore coat polysaccharide biosynthesis protein SpsF